VIRGFCSALKHAHAEGVIHADLKPGNLFVTHAGQVKIFDFGLARAVQSNFARGVFQTRNDVEDMIFDTAALGALTPAYASRSMLQGSAPNASDDVYAAALVIYQVLTGKHPYNRIPADKVDPRSVSLERPKQLSSRQWRVLSQALALEEANRLPSVAALQAGLFEKSLWPMRLLATSLGVVAVALWYFSLQKDDQILVVQQQAQQAGRVNK
jgi:serine/threonine protein kinase